MIQKQLQTKNSLESMIMDQRDKVIDIIKFYNETFIGAAKLFVFTNQKTGSRIKNVNKPNL